MQLFLTRLLRASRWGATLVLAAGYGTTASGCGGGDGDAAVDTLEPLPALPLCEGPTYTDPMGGYSGQCCYEVHCAAPTDDNLCVGPSEADLTNLPPGSGTCECGSRSGPFANADPAAVEACCYLVGVIGCEGRPLMIAGEARLADVVPGTAAWSSLRVDASCTGDLALDEVLSRRWAERARYEHASVASFARFSMALLACGAPPELVAASQRAGADEVRHAQLALSLASTYAGRPLDLGPLDIEGAFAGPVTLEAVTLSTVVEACVGETLSAIEIAACAGAATSKGVREALSAIAEDETRHAELGWAFVRWAASAGRPGLRAAIAQAFEQAFEKASVDVNTAPADDVAGVADHGFLPSAEVTALRRQAITEVLRPAAIALTREAARPAARPVATAQLSV